MYIYIIHNIIYIYIYDILYPILSLSISTEFPLNGMNKSPAMKIPRRPTRLAFA